ncbi:hypothetical protein [Brevibacillus daliensis]|uniref:hypothetical protein n=1 Tax=Brevibacillus daliensis TaxID=2892995 RepID=UPI001E3A62B8|nr:hypothetical protein [Brevibacillus daliensis]
MYNFEELKSDIALGREVEFQYKGEKYSITFSSNGWCFTKFYENENQIIFDEIEKINKILINGKSLRDIFDKNELEDLTIY